MRRRAFIALLGTALASAPFAARDLIDQATEYLGVDVANATQLDRLAAR
jgi:hypothetical protein